MIVKQEMVVKLHRKQAGLLHAISVFHFESNTIMAS